MDVVRIVRHDLAAGGVRSHELAGMEEPIRRGRGGRWRRLRRAEGRGTGRQGSVREHGRGAEQLDRGAAADASSKEVIKGTHR
jgi:hypothetical protein